MNTPTPRTDAATALTSQHRYDDSFGDPEFGWVTAGFARELERELAAERAKVCELRACLQNLCDEQNGAPLERRREQWQTTMDEARAALAATEDKQ